MQFEKFVSTIVVLAKPTNRRDRERDLVGTTAESDQWRLWPDEAVPD